MCGPTSSSIRDHGKQKGKVNGSNVGKQMAKCIPFLRHSKRTQPSREPSNFRVFLFFFFFFSLERGSWGNDGKEMPATSGSIDGRKKNQIAFWSLCTRRKEGKVKGMLRREGKGSLTKRRPKKSNNKIVERQEGERVKKKKKKKKEKKGKRKRKKEKRIEGGEGKGGGLAVKRKRESGRIEVM